MSEEGSDTDSVDSGLFRDSSGSTIQDYPGEIENSYLLGIDDSGGWYYEPISNTIDNYQFEGGKSSEPLELTPQFSLDSDEVEEAFDDISELAKDLVDRTVLGHSLVLADRLTKETHFSEPQAKVYSLREVYGVGRNQTARILDKSPNTIDNQRNNAKRKAEKAKSFIEIMREYAPD